MVFGNGNFATAVPFTRVLAGATVVTRFAATLPLAVVLAFAAVLGRRRTTAMAFTRVLASAPVVTGFTAPLALALVHALARMLLAAFGCLFLSNYTANLSTSKNPSHSAEQQFVEISSFHTHSGIPHKSIKRYVYPARDPGTHLAAIYAAISVSGQDVPNHRGLAAKLTPHGNVHGPIPANASAYA